MTYFAINALEQFDKLVPYNYSQRIATQINKARIYGKVILEAGSTLTKPKYEEQKYLPKEYMLLTSSIIYSDKVTLFIWTEPFVQILIRNRHVAKSYKTQFNILWKLAREKN